MSLRYVLRLAACGLALAICLGCGPRRLSFTAGGGQVQRVRASGGRGQEGWYRLRRPAAVEAGNRALYLRYRGDPGGAQLTVYGLSALSSRQQAPGQEAEAIAGRRLPDVQPGAEVVVYVPLPAGSVVAGFDLGGSGGGAAREAAAGAGTDAGLQLLAAGLGPGRHGLERAAGALHLGPEVAGFRETLSGFVLSLTPAVSVGEQGQEPEGARAGAPGGLQWQMLVEYSSQAAPAWAQWKRLEAAAQAAPRPSRVEASVLLQAGGRRKLLEHRALEGAQRLALPGPLVGFQPQSLTVAALGGGILRIEGLRIRPLGAALEPIDADAGGILAYPQELWRAPRYELFAWARRPEILIMDTASYEVQSRFFKRLAFYVEKRGYRGRLLSNGELAEMHGYNAHDYRAEDLAGFFAEARRQRFTLNPEEELLARILLDNGVLREDTDYQPGRGGILSISRSSSVVLRQHLLTHECYHGLFFLLPEYQAAALREWQTLRPLERSFWELFFAWVGYDVQEPYLAANEYQAYLFQQERSAVEAYFRGLTAPRLMARYPQAEPEIRALLAQSPGSFAAGFERLEPWLVRHAGVEGGRVIELFPADPGG